MMRTPSSFRQAMWGGYTCETCGTEMDKWAAPAVAGGRLEWSERKPATYKNSPEVAAAMPHATSAPARNSHCPMPPTSSADRFGSAGS